MLRSPLVRLAAATALTAAFAAPLSGCLVADNEARIGDLEATDVQNALDEAGSALDEANSALKDAFGGIGENIGGSIDGLIDLLGNLADTPALLSGLFKDGELAASSSRLEIVDAQSGDTIKIVEDPNGFAQIGQTFSAMDTGSWNLVSSHPDAGTGERVLRFFRPPTETVVGGDSQRAVETLTITTYRDSNIIEIVVAPIDFTLDLELPDADIAALRSIV